MKLYFYHHFNSPKKTLKFDNKTQKMSLKQKDKLRKLLSF